MLLQHREQNRTLIICCGAIARELLVLKKINGWVNFEIQALPAELHNKPNQIAGAVLSKIENNCENFDTIICGYADCGTGGELDYILDLYDIKRLSGPHCYSFFSGNNLFDELQKDELGTFYLTDFLARQFDTLVVKGLGLDKYPSLRETYFENYTRLVYLAQSNDPTLQYKAEKAAEQLLLTYEFRFTGLDPLSRELESLIGQEE